MAIDYSKIYQLYKQQNPINIDPSQIDNSLQVDNNQQPIAQIDYLQQQTPIIDDNQQKLEEINKQLQDRYMKEMLTGPTKQKEYNLASPYTEAKKAYEGNGKKSILKGILGGIEGLVGAATSPSGLQAIGGITALTGGDPYIAQGIAQAGQQFGEQEQQRKSQEYKVEQDRMNRIKDYLKEKGKTNVLGNIDMFLKLHPDYYLEGLSAQGKPLIRHKFKNIFVDTTSGKTFDAKGNEVDPDTLEKARTFTMKPSLNYEKEKTQQIGNVKLGLLEKEQDIKKRSALSKDIETEARKAEFGLNMVNQIQNLLNEIPVSEGVGGIIEGGIQKAGSISKMNTNATAYDSFRKGAVFSLAKQLGNTGNPSDSDMKRAENLIPSLTDPADVRDKKISNLTNLLQSISEQKNKNKQINKQEKKIGKYKIVGIE